MTTSPDLNEADILALSLHNVDLAIQRGLVAAGYSSGARFALRLETRLTIAGLHTGNRQETLERARLLIQKLTDSSEEG